MGIHNEIRDVEDLLCQNNSKPLLLINQERGGVIWVTDLCRVEWCGLQTIYQAIYGRPKQETQAMLHGTAIHAAMEAELVQRIEVNAESKEDVVALRIIGTISQLQQLIQKGITRELDVFARLQLGQPWISGKIDEIRLQHSRVDIATAPDPEHPKSTVQDVHPWTVTVEDDGAASFKGAESKSVADSVAKEIPLVAQIVEIKTRKHPSIPRDGQIRNACLQVLIYHKLYEHFRKSSLGDLEQYFLRDGVLPSGPISSALQDHCSQLLPDHPASLVWEKQKQHLEPEAVRIPQSGGLRQGGSSGESTGMSAPQSSCSIEAPASSSPHHFKAPASSSPHHFEAPASSSPHLLTKNCVMPMKAEESPDICNEEPRRSLRCPQESTVSIAASSSWTVSALIQYLHDAVLPLLPPASSGSSAVSATACVSATEYGGWKYPPHLIRYWYQGLPSEDMSRNNLLRKRKYGDASGRGADYRQGCDPSVRMMSTSAAAADHDHDEGVHMKAGCVDGHVHELGLDNTVTRLGHAVEAAAIAHISQDVMANRCRVSKEEIVLDVPRQPLAKEGSVTEGLSVTAKGLLGMGPRPLGDGSCDGCKSREGGALVNTGGGFISPDTKVRYEEWSDWLDYTMGQVLEVLRGRAEGRGVEAGEEWKCNFCDFRAKEQSKDQGVLRESNSEAIMCTWKSTSCS